MKDFEVITSKENKTLKNVSKLVSSSSERRKQGVFVLEGERLCFDALQNGVSISLLAVSYSACEKYPEKVNKLLEKSTEAYRLPDALFEKISDTKTPQGILTLCPLPDTENASLKKDGRYIALENVSDPSNIGAVARTAEALGIDALIVSGGCDPYSPKALRASMGALLRIRVAEVSDLSAFLKNSGLTVYCAVVDKDAEKLGSFAFTDGSVTVIGNEANGITKEMRASAEHLITIPMSGRAESLNAAAAASVIMWEMVK